MKITSFNPLIATAHSDEIIKLYEDLGFEKHHSKKESGLTTVITQLSE